MFERLMFLLILGISIQGCDDWEGWGSCDVDCEDRYDDCLDGNRSEQTCEAERRKCLQTCKDARQESAES